MIATVCYQAKVTLCFEADRHIGTPTSVMPVVSKQTPTPANMQYRPHPILNASLTKRE